MFYEDFVSGKIHPLIFEAMFCANQMKLDIHLQCMSDFFEKKTRRLIAKKLYMGRDLPV